jgi:bacterioferritin
MTVSKATHRARRGQGSTSARSGAVVQGEGDYRAARRYERAVKHYLRSADVDRAVRNAAPRNAREARELGAAEEAGRRHAAAEPGESFSAGQNHWFSESLAAIRLAARQHLSSGAVTQNYRGSVEQAVALLNHAVATEVVCVLRYKYHAVVAAGISSEAVREEFAQHAKEEEQHLDLLCERINQLGGRPCLNPAGVTDRAASQYIEGETLIEMIKENLVAERIAIETYRDMVRYFADKDPSTRIILERILAQEEEHANDMHDLLVQHEGRPTLPR